jgi:pimeloyl-ACP methyl ester carboxylesterase
VASQEDAPPAHDGDRLWGTPPPDDDLSLPEGESFVVTTDDGARLAVTVAPLSVERLPVVLPHCWTGDRRVWVPVARRLVVAGHPVVLYDQRGHGTSTIGAAPLSVERLGADLAAVLDDVGAPEVVLAGHSMGGMTVMAHAAHHPDALHDRVRGLVLVATAAHGVGGRAGRRALRILLWRSWIDAVVGRPRLGRAFVRGTFGVGPHPAHVETTRALFADTAAGVRRDCALAMGAMDLRAGLRAVDLPTVVMLGRRDTLIPNRVTRAIADCIRGARVVRLPRAGHMLPFERPDEIAAQIAQLARRR